MHFVPHCFSNVTACYLKYRYVVVKSTTTKFLYSLTINVTEYLKCYIQIRVVDVSEVLIADIRNLGKRRFYMEFSHSCSLEELTS